MILIALCLQVAYENEDLGIVVRELPGGLEIRRAEKAAFEVLDADRKACGAAHVLAGWPRARGRADQWEEAVRKDAATKSLKQVREEVLQPALGEGLRREWEWGRESETVHVLGLFLSRGDRTLRLILWGAADARESRARLAEQVELHHVWRCGACGASARGGRDACAKCEASLYPRDDRIREFSRTFEVQIVLDTARFTPVGNVALAASTRRDAEAFCPMLAREVKKYPDEFFRRIDLGRILLCRNIGFPNPPPGKVLAFAMFQPEFVFVIDVSEKQKFATIHHEFFHFVDFLPDYSTKDEAWCGLNDKEFRYDSKLWAESLRDSKQKGFISEYARASEAEDKAELFACLMMDQKRARVKARDDAILAKKAERLKEIVREFCPKMDDEHWKAIDK